MQCIRCNFLQNRFGATHNRYIFMAKNETKTVSAQQEPSQLKQNTRFGECYTSLGCET